MTKRIREFATTNTGGVNRPQEYQCLNGAEIAVVESKVCPKGCQASTEFVKHGRGLVSGY